MLRALSSCMHFTLGKFKMVRTKRTIKRVTELKIKFNTESIAMGI